MEVPPGRAREASLLLALGQLPAARTTIRGLQGRLRQSADLSLALADHDWRRADSLASWLQGQPQVATPVMVEAIATRATVAAVRGELSAAEALLRQAGELQHEKGSPSLASRAGRGLVTLALASGQPVPRAAPWLERDTTTSGLITRAYMAAAAGDTSRARRLLAGIRSRPGTRLGANGSTPEFIEACIAARAGRWGDAIALIAVAAREGSDRGDALFDRIGVTPERLLVAQAYERLGEPDSAAAFYLRLLGPECSRSLDSFAHQSLVMIYARMGRREEAEMHWQAFSVVFTSPDPVVRHLLDEARTAIVGLRAMAPHRG
jgi:tetratricopeptide (TPR) repeat protein